MVTRFKKATTFLISVGLALGSVAYAQEQQKPMDQKEQKQEKVLKSDTESGVLIYERQVLATGDGTRLETTIKLPEGIAPKEDARIPAAEEAIRNVISTAVDAALAGDTDKLIEQLSGPDRERFESQTDADWNPLTKTTGFLNKTWKESYGLATANVTKDDLSATYMAVRIGEIEDGVKLTEWPLEPTPTTNLMQKKGAGTADYMEPGRDVAVVVLPSANGLPELTVSMTHEAPDFWKIDVPDDMTLKALQESLTLHLNHLNENARSWPADEDETERLITRHVLMGIYGVDAEMDDVEEAQSTTPEPRG